MSETTQQPPVDVQLALLKALVEGQGKQLDAQDRRLEHMEAALDELTSLANRWKGGFWVVLGLGGLATTLAVGLSHFFKTGP